MLWLTLNGEGEPLSTWQCRCAPSSEHSHGRACWWRGKCWADLAKLFPWEKTTILITWNNLLTLPAKGKRINEAVCTWRGWGERSFTNSVAPLTECWFTVIPFISFLIKHLLKDQTCQCDLRPIAWSVKWGKLPGLLAMIESFWKEIENQYLSSLHCALYSEGQFVSVICMSIVGAYKVTVLVMQSEMTVYEI